MRNIPPYFPLLFKRSAENGAKRRRTRSTPLYFRLYWNAAHDCSNRNQFSFQGRIMKKKKQEKIEYTSEEEKREKHFQSLFPKEKEKKKRKKTARVDAAEVARFNADLDEGLSKIQVEQRQEQGLVNKTKNIPRRTRAFSSAISALFSTCSVFWRRCCSFPRTPRSRSLPLCSSSSAISAWAFFRKSAPREK